MPEEKEPQKQPPQTQSRQPGIESEMTPRPKAEDARYRGADKLLGKVALITGGDSGIGRAAASVFARVCMGLADDERSVFPLFYIIYDRAILQPLPSGLGIYQ
jgi:hypothetical protein